jgi:hypothetical protein
VELDDFRDFVKNKSVEEITFIVANALAEKLGWTRERFVNARGCLEGSHPETVLRYSLKNDPALYRWKRLR